MIGLWLLNCGPHLTHFHYFLMAESCLVFELGVVDVTWDVNNQRILLSVDTILNVQIIVQYLPIMQHFQVFLSDVLFRG